MGTFLATNGILKVIFTNLTLAILKNLEFFLKFRQIFFSDSRFRFFLQPYQLFLLHIQSFWSLSLFVFVKRQ